MATWDGSYPEDLSYLMCADRSEADTATGSWPYLAGNAAYLRDVSAGGYYPGAESGRHVYEQSGPTTALYQIGAQHPSNMVPSENNAYRKRVLPDALSTDSARASNGVAPTSHNGPPFSRGGYRPRPRGNRTAGKHAPPSPAGDVVQSIVVENSDLHPTASEFVPNSQAKFRKDSRFRKYNNATGNGFNANAQEFRPKSAALSSSDNVYKGERRYDNRRDGNYRQKKPQDPQAPPRSGYRDTNRTYNARNYNKFQNGRYYNRKYQSDVPPTEQNAAREARAFTTDATDSATSSSQENRTVVEEIQEDDSSWNRKISSSSSREEILTHEDNDSENTSSKILETQRNNGRPKRFANASNYHRYNSDDMQSEPGTRRKTTVTAAKYTQRRNNEMTSYKDKKVENWRDRTESNETAHVPQGKNPRKKYDIGIFIRSIQEIALLHKKKNYNDCYFVCSYQMMTRARGKD